VISAKMFKPTADFLMIDVGDLIPVKIPNRLITLGKPVGKCLHYRNRPTLMNASIPKEFDWRERTGADGDPILAPVVNQGNCGSCYAG
jgi:C1A family cysteine protease